MQVNNIIDPRIITQADMPLIVLSEQANSFVSFLIDWRTRGNFDHAMLAINEGQFCVQGFTGYKQEKMDLYLIKGGYLKFIQLVNANDNFKYYFTQSVQNRLALPWYRKLYDVVGIAGQALGLQWLHTPGLEYCSVDVIRHLKNASTSLPAHDMGVINAIPPETNPQDLDNIIHEHPEIFSVYGVWSADEGVTV